MTAAEACNPTRNRYGRVAPWRSSLLPAMALLTLLAAALPADARPGQSSGDPVLDAATAATLIFSGRERDILRDYLHEERGKKPKSLPPGLRQQLERGRDLPPGWQDKVRRGEVLDADLYRHSRSLPREILRRLPAQPDGTRLRVVDDRVVRLAEATNLIVDVFYLDP